MKKHKLLIVGYGRHGKDTVCELLKENWGFTFDSSSHFCARLFIFDMLKDKYGYKTFDECYEDRHNHRAEWFNLICDYNKDDPSRLGRAIFDEFDIYCGLRNKDEFVAMKNEGIFDYAIWVDRSEHQPPESSDSNTITASMCDFIIDNNESLFELELNVDGLMARISS